MRSLKILIAVLIIAFSVPCIAGDPLSLGQAVATFEGKVSKLKTVAAIESTENGEIMSIKIRSSSGNREFDMAVVRAIQMAGTVAGMRNNSSLEYVQESDSFKVVGK
jgi:TonB family protein